MSQQQFIQTQVEKFISNECPNVLSQPQNLQKQTFYNKLNEYENQFFQQQAENDQQMTQTQNDGQFNTFMQYLQRQMISQASTNTKYQRLLINLDQPGNLNAVADPLQQDIIDLNKEFEQRIPNYNGNTSRIDWQQIQEKNKQAPLMTKDDFLNLHYSMVNLPLEPGVAPQDPQIHKLKQNIELLGGIDDCVGAMEQTLNDYEIKHLNEKYIHYYTYYNKQREEEERIRQQEEELRLQQQSQYNPFFTHPKEMYQKSNLNYEGQQPIFNKTTNDFGRFNQSQFQFQEQQQKHSQQQNQQINEQQNQQTKRNMLEEFKKKREDQLQKLESWKKSQGF